MFLLNSSVKTLNKSYFDLKGYFCERWPANTPKTMCKTYGADPLHQAIKKKNSCF